jgi:hypothetical protein
VIPPEAFDFWLDCRHVDANSAAALLVPAPEELFEAHEISPAVNRVTNDYPGLLEPMRAGAQAAETVEPDAPAGAASSPAGAPAKRARKPKKDDRQSSLF